MSPTVSVDVLVNRSKLDIQGTNRGSSSESPVPCEVDGIQKDRITSVKYRFQNVTVYGQILLRRTTITTLGI